MSDMSNYGPRNERPIDELTAADIRITMDNGCGCCEPRVYDVQLVDGSWAEITPEQLGQIVSRDQS